MPVRISPRHQRPDVNHGDRRPFDPSTSSGSSRVRSRDDKLRVVPSKVEGRARRGRFLELGGLGGLRGPVRVCRPWIRLRVPAFVAALSAAACGGSGPAAPTRPSPTPTPAASAANVSGTWSGPASDSSGPGQMSWQITQTDASFSGTVTMTDTSTGVGGSGSVSGTVAGSTIHFSISIPAAGFQSPFTSCTASVSGDGQATSSSITGTYTGSNSCSGAIAAGQLTLNKQ